MDNNHLAAYLSDHLTGSEKMACVLAELRTDIEADREEGVCSKLPFTARSAYRMFQTCLRSHATTRTIPASTTKSPEINTMTKTQSPRAARLDSLPA
jgi:hypothetical protein